MKAFAFAASLMLFTACSSTELVPGEGLVKIVEKAPASCEFVSEVEGQYQGGSIPSGVLLDKKVAARLDLKRQTALLSADTVAVKSDRGEYVAGDAYRCDLRLPASR